MRKSPLPVLILATATLAYNGTPRSATHLARAARQGDVATVRGLIAAGADVNAFDRGGNQWTPLLHAIHKGQRESVQVLIAAGADVNRASPPGLSPLEMAAGNGQADIVRRLLEAGANPRETGVFTVAVSGGASCGCEFHQSPRPILPIRPNPKNVRVLPSLRAQLSP